ncbi:hypothetical protein NBRC10512v2_003145 [Rhodotorula toruloides]
MFAGQGPSPAQMALAKQQARLSIRQFLITIGLLRAAHSLDGWRRGEAAPLSLLEVLWALFFPTLAPLLLIHVLVEIAWCTLTVALACFLRDEREWNAWIAASPPLNACRKTPPSEPRTTFTCV